MWMVKGQQIGRMGSYRWNTRTLLSRASRECYRIFDINLDLNPVPFEAFKDRIHPDDFPALEQALVEAVSTKSPFSHEYRVVHRDGTTLRVIAEGEFDLGPTGDVELEGKDPRAGTTGVQIRQRRLSEIQRHVLRVSCRRCERTVEIQTADAVRLYGGNAVWKDVAQRLLDDTCQQRTGRHEEDGCWPAFETP